MGVQGVCNQNPMNSIENFPFHHHAQVIYNFTWGCDEEERVSDG